MSTTLLIALSGGLIAAGVLFYLFAASSSGESSANTASESGESPAKAASEPELENDENAASTASRSRGPAPRDPDSNGPGGLGQNEDTEVAEDGGTHTLDRNELDAIVKDHDDDEAYFIVLSGPRTGEMIRLDQEYVIGRDENADVQFRDETVSSSHARVRRSNGNIEIDDLDSSNGTFVEGQSVDRTQLEDGNKVTIGKTTVLKFTFQDRLDEQFQKRLYETSTRDRLTNAYEKAHFTEQMESELSYCTRHGVNFCVVMFDIDHFKEINDTHGHVAGDDILRELADRVRGATRDESIFVRYGGEEFIVAERGADREAGRKIGERIRKTIASEAFAADNQQIDVTISVGVGDLDSAAEPSTEALIESADEALYEAKRGGRNQVVVADG